jgi:hypothetical protein
MRITSVSIAVGLAWLIGCRNTPPEAIAGGAGPDYDLSAIDLDRFAADAATRSRVLHMPFGEAAARLGSLRFEARSDFLFSRGGVEVEQKDVYAVTQDSLGNFHVVLDTPNSQIEFFLVGETVYVRHDNGHLREKPRRAIDADAWCEIAFASQRQALEFFQPRLQFSHPTPDKSTPRPSIRYTLSLADQAVDHPPPPETQLPVSPPARWRELARPLDLRGHVWVDYATGVLSRVDLAGRIEIADRQVRPTQLSLRFESGVTDAAKVAPVRPGASIPELRRDRKPRDPLSFFRDRLPREEAVEKERRK